MRPLFTTLLLALGWLLMPLTGTAQEVTITGQLLLASDSTEVVGASVKLRRTTDSTTVSGTVSDDKGYFKVKGERASFGEAY